MVEILHTTLREITGDVAAIVTRMNDLFADELMSDEARDAAIANEFERFGASLEAVESKLENCKFVIRDWEGQIQTRKLMIDELTAANRSDEAKQERLRDYMLLCLRSLEGNKVKTPFLSAWISRRKSVEIFDEQLLPLPAKRPELYRFKPPEINKKSLQEAIEAGGIEGARINEREFIVIK